MLSGPCAVYAFSCISHPDHSFPVQTVALGLSTVSLLVFGLAFGLALGLGLACTLGAGSALNWELQVWLSIKMSRSSPGSSKLSAAVARMAITSGDRLIDMQLQLHIHTDMCIGCNQQQTHSFTPS